MDSRPEVAAQFQRMEMIGNSHQAMQHKARLSLIAKSQNTLQQKSSIDHITGQSLTLVQREEDPLQAQSESEAPLQCETQDSHKPNNTGLPDQLKSGIESLSGMSMDHVKVHYNSSQPAQLNALAYAQGSDIHIGAGQEQHLPHEAWHIVQQAQGRVKPTMQMKEGVPVNDDAGLEHEADVMGARALQTKSAAEHLVPSSLGSSNKSLAQLQGNGKIIQRVVVQSDWLKFDRTGEEKKTLLSQSSAGPWSECTDKTNAGYRIAAETVLGDRSILYTLAKHKIIPAPITGGRNPFTRSHLIAAEFGGQLKFSPPANVRYHPEPLEYGAWQAAETTVSRDGLTGYITVASDENSPALGYQMARKISDGLREVVPRDDLAEIERELAHHLRVTQFIPPTVVFRYDDIEDPSRNFRHEWGGQDAGLAVVDGLNPGIILPALLEAGIRLPESCEKARDEASSSIPSFTINSKADLVQLIKSFTCEKKRKNTIIASLNKQFGISHIDNEKFVALLKSLPELQSQVLNIVLTVDFHTFASTPLTIEEVL